MISNNQGNNYQLTKTQLELSLVYRDEGNVERAKQLAAEALKIAQTSDIKNVAIGGLIDLGLAFMSGGDFDDAGNYFQQALDLAQRANSDAGKARAHLSLGRLDYQKSDNDQAITNLKRALDFYEKANYRRETSLTLTLLGRAYQDRGEDAEALKLFDRQFQLVKDGVDDSGLADSHMNFALLSGNEEKYPDALAHLDEKLKLDQKRESKRGQASDQMNRGVFLWRLGRYDEARAALDSSMELASEPGANLKTVIAWVHLIRARLAASQLQYAEARKEAQTALDLSDKFRDVALQAKACMGLAMAMSGSASQGKTLCDDALAMAQQVKSPILITSTQLALAEVMLLNKDAAGARDLALALQKVFAQSGQPDSEWRALMIAARASELAGDKSAAHNYASQAEQVCSSLSEKWGAGAFQSYLKRPDVQMYRQQLSQLTGIK